MPASFKIKHSPKIKHSGHGAAPKHVIGDLDERTQVLDTTVNPFSSIAHLLALNPAGQVSGHATGWFAGPRIVITAAHFVAPIRNGAPQKVSAVRVIPGHNVGAVTPIPFGQEDSTHVEFAPGWATPNREPHDFGAVFLATPMPAAVGALPPGVFADADLGGLVANLTGYPILPPGNALLGTQWGASGAVRPAAQAGLLEYEIDMELGQSGAPLLASVQGHLSVIGINTLGVFTSNNGVRMTAAVASQLSAWIAQSTT